VGSTGLLRGEEVSSQESEFRRVQTFLGSVALVFGGFFAGEKAGARGFGGWEVFLLTSDFCLLTSLRGRRQRGFWDGFLEAAWNGAPEGVRVPYE